MARVVASRYVDQGGGKRKGSFAIYLEPWHADIFDFLDLKKNHGKEEVRCGRQMRATGTMRARHTHLTTPALPHAATRP